MLQSTLGIHTNPLMAFLADEKTKDKIHRHLNDINDQISEDDIRNVKTGDYEEVKKEVLEDEENSEKKDGNNSNDINTVWNTLTDE